MGNAMRAALTTSRPNVKLPTPPITAPMPNGTALPSVFDPILPLALSASRAITVATGASAESGSCCVSTSPQPLGSALLGGHVDGDARGGGTPGRGGLHHELRHLALRLLAQQHAEHERLGALGVLDLDAVQLGGGEHEQGARLVEEQQVRHAQPERQRDPHGRDGGRRADAGAGDRHGGDVALLELLEDLGGGGVGLVAPHRLEVLDHHGPLHGDRLIDLLLESVRRGEVFGALHGQLGGGLLGGHGGSCRWGGAEALRLSAPLTLVEGLPSWHGERPVPSNGVEPEGPATLHSLMALVDPGCLLRRPIRLPIPAVAARGTNRRRQAQPRS